MNASAAFREYDVVWPADFERERQALLTALNGTALNVHHVGSTAIPGMPGKGIIDMLVTVTSLEPESAYADPLARLGYIRRPVPERPESPFFTKPAEKPRTHNVHIAEAGSRSAESMVAFRDYLRASPEAANRYESAKRALVAERPGDWSFYSENKPVIADELEREAMDWRSRGNVG